MVKLILGVLLLEGKLKLEGGWLEAVEGLQAIAGSEVAKKESLPPFYSNAIAAKINPIPNNAPLGNRSCFDRVGYDSFFSGPPRVTEGMLHHPLCNM